VPRVCDRLDASVGHRRGRAVGNIDRPVGLPGTPDNRVRDGEPGELLVGKHPLLASRAAGSHRPLEARRDRPKAGSRLLA
jgi:hypothetical protein